MYLPVGLSLSFQSIGLQRNFVSLGAARDQLFENILNPGKFDGSGRKNQFYQHPRGVKSGRSRGEGGEKSGIRRGRRQRLEALPGPKNSNKPRKTTNSCILAQVGFKSPIQKPSKTLGKPSCLASWAQVGFEDGCKMELTKPKTDHKKQQQNNGKSIIWELMSPSCLQQACKFIQLGPS